MSTLALPLLIVVATFGYLVISRRRLGERYRHLQVGAVSAKLGLQLIDGDPAHNLATDPIQPGAQNLTSAKGFLRQMAATQVGGSLGETKLYAVGYHHGLQTELMLYCCQRVEPGARRTATTTWYDLRLTVHAPHAVPTFDLRLRHESPGLQTRRGPDDVALPERRLVDPLEAERYLLTTTEPSLPGRLVGLLGALAQLPYVHLTGAGNQLSFVMTPPALMSSSFFLEQILHALLQLSAALGACVPAAMPLARAVAAR